MNKTILTKLCLIILAYNVRATYASSVGRVDSIERENLSMEQRDGLKEKKISNCLIGTIVEFNKKNDGRVLEGYNVPFYHEAIMKLAKTHFLNSDFSKYYTEKDVLGFTKLAVPIQSSGDAARMLGVPFSASYLVVFRGKLVPGNTKRFRFWGSFDNLMLIQVDGSTVLDAKWNGECGVFGTKWKSEPTEGVAVRPYTAGAKFTPSSWIRGVANKPLDLVIAIGEPAGGMTGGYLFVEEEGAKYDVEDGYTKFPLFVLGQSKQEKLSRLNTRGKYQVSSEGCPEFRVVIPKGTGNKLRKVL